jgi:hypothetical protein
VSDAGRGGPDDAEDVSDLLRAKYHDYCSAQLADLVLFLSPDEIYVLAQKATGVKPSASRSFAEVVTAATEWLAARIALPPFEVWVQDYRANPEQYQKYLMGFWESELEPTADPH